METKIRSYNTVATPNICHSEATKWPKNLNASDSSSPFRLLRMTRLIGDFNREGWNICEEYLGMAESEKVVRKGGQKRWSELTKKQQIILGALKNNPKISRGKLTEDLNINPSAVQKHIKKLKEEGMLKRIGPDKGGYWEIAG